MAVGPGGCDARLFAFKVAVLLHDVPWKPWVVLRKPGRILARGAREAAGYFGLNADGLKANDVEALEFLKRVINAVKGAGHDGAAEELRRAAGELRSRVEGADSRASSADRLVIGSLLHENACKSLDFSVQKLVYINPFRPSVWMETCKRLDAEWIRGAVERYVDEVTSLIREALSEARDADECSVLKLVYNLLYAFLEPLWYKATRGECPAPPADTRIPTHTIFDHLYASVLASNMEYCGNDEWLVVFVDLPGVQEFVGAGRKTRDYWAGSWLVSLMAWRAVERLVDSLGPDVLMLPAATGNPFYYTYLVSLVNEVAGGEAARRVSEELSRLMLTWRDEWPSQPLMPATLTLILPACLSSKASGEATRQIIQTIRDSVAESWSRVAVTLLERAAKLLGDEAQEGIHVYREYLDDVKRKIREEKRSPIAVKVAVVEGARISKLAESYANKVVERVRKELEGGLAGKLKGHCEARALDGGLVSVESLRRLLSFHLAFASVGVEAAATYTPRGAYAAWISDVVRDHSRKAYEGNAERLRMCSVCGRLPAVVYMKPIREGGVPTVLIDEREALCPVCLVKRLAGYMPGMVLETLGYEGVRAEKRPVLSTEDLACYWDDVRRAVERGDVGEEEARRECEWIAVFAEASGRKGELEALVDACRKARHWMRDEERKRVCRLTEYAAVRGDGDKIGSGLLRGRLATTPGQYVEEIYGVLEKAVAPRDSWKLRLLGEAHRVIVEALASVAGGEATVPVTPAYLYALSRSLMATAAVDSRVIEALGGVLVFAGGDDVYALLPLTSPAVRLGGEPGSRRLNPALAAVLGSYVELYGKDSIYYDEVGRRLDAKLWEARTGTAPPRLPLNGPVSVPALAVIFTRLNYWGILDSWANGKLSPGFHVHPGMVVAAVVAYGRSYGVNVAHVRDYLWRVYRAALALEEMKDDVRFHPPSIKDGKALEKDVTIVAFKAHDGGEASVIPNIIPSRGRVEDEVTPTDRDTPLLLLARLYGLIGFALSRSLVYDALSPTPDQPFIHAYAQAGGSPSELARLLASLLRRNLRMRGSGGHAAVKRVVEAAAGVLASRVEVKGPRDPLLTHVFKALRSLHE